jgi:hypothetical protein
MEHDLRNTLALIERFPATLNTLLRDLPEAWTKPNEGGDSWSAYDIIGHLIHGEKTDWIARTKRILEHGENKPFDKFDRMAQFNDSKGKILPQLLDEFARLRAENVNTLKALSLKPADLAKRGKHQILGTVTLSQLLATWAAHDLSHLHQLSRVLAYQYREAVGPWTKFLGVMQCQGHSE